jgi:hypothetical protein
MASLVPLSIQGMRHPIHEESIAGHSSRDAHRSYTAAPSGPAPAQHHPAPRRPTHRPSGLHTAWLTAAVLSLAACGGGDDGPQDNSGSGASPPPSLQGLTGEWVQRGCVRTGPQSFKRLIRATLVPPRALDYAEGVLSFNSSDCTGTAQRAGPTLQGTLVFNRSEANASLVAHWGELTTVTGHRSGAIWTLQSNGLLCLLGDRVPSIQPTLGQVAASLATIPADNCFQRRIP